MAAMEGFRDGRFRVLVATDIAARGIDVTALGLVVNVDVPHVPEDYIHRVGRTARASATGEAYTFVSPDEEADLRAIERHLGKPLPRHRADGFDYAARPTTRLEIPLAERLAVMRARRADERARAAAKTGRPAFRGTARPDNRPSQPGQRKGPQAFDRRSGNPARVGAGLAWLRQASGRPR
jgi:ATP-dependent RNA helicase RhlE